jgi:hypothetical protein
VNCVILESELVAGMAQSSCAPSPPTPLPQGARGVFLCRGFASRHASLKPATGRSRWSLTCVGAASQLGWHGLKAVADIAPLAPCGRGAGGEGRHVCRFTTEARSAQPLFLRSKTALAQPPSREFFSSAQYEGSTLPTAFLCVRVRAHVTRLACSSLSREPSSSSTQSARVCRTSPLHFVPRPAGASR